MKAEDIIPCLNECLKFMHENRVDVPLVLPQHIIQHLQNVGMEHISLIEAISLLNTLETNGAVSIVEGKYSLNRSGVMLHISGGFQDSGL